MSAAMAELGGPPTSSESEPVSKDCPVLPFEQAKALHRRIVHRRFLQVPFQPNLKEVIVAITVMAVTIVVSLSGMVLVW
jgi:hypothetical protein